MGFDDVPRESAIEREAMRFAESRGWFQVKLMRCSINGMPDRLLVRNSRVIFIEFKRSRKGPRIQQKRRHNDLRSHGAETYVIDNLEAAKELLR